MCCLEREGGHFERFEESGNGGVVGGSYRGAVGMFKSLRVGRRDFNIPTAPLGGRLECSHVPQTLVMERFLKSILAAKSELGLHTT